MKRLLTLVLAAVLVFSLTACGSTSEKTEDTSELSAPPTPTQAELEEEAWQKEPAYGTTIHVGYDGGLCQAPIPLAYLKGFFEAEGLDVELAKSGDGTQAAVSAALAGGKIDTTAGMISG